jgi:exonuclease III
MFVWNADGLRARLRASQGFSDFVSVESPDIMAILETKWPGTKTTARGIKSRIPWDGYSGGGSKPRNKSLASDFQAMRDLFSHKPFSAYRQLWASSGDDQKTSYAGTLLLLKKSTAQPLSFRRNLYPNERDEVHGRVFVLEYQTTTVIFVYTPNTGNTEKTREARVLWDLRLREYILRHQDGNAAKRLVICGDLNATLEDEEDMSNVNFFRHVCAGLRIFTGEGPAPADVKDQGFPSSTLNEQMRLRQTLAGGGLEPVEVQHEEQNSAKGEATPPAHATAILKGAAFSAEWLRLDYVIVSRSLRESCGHLIVGDFLGSDHRVIGVKFDESVLGDASSSSSCSDSSSSSSASSSFQKKQKSK